MEEKVIKYSNTKAEKVDKRVLRFVGSDESTDRDGDIIRTSGWKLSDYKKNPVVLFGHNMSAAPIAKTNRVWVDKTKKQLMFDIEFPTEDVSTIGDSLYKLYKSGFMNAVSVGFMPNFEKITYPEKKKGVYRIMEEQALHEISLVSVPANQNALITSKSMAKAVEQKILNQDALDEFIKAAGIEDEKDDEFTKAIKRITELEETIIKLEETVKGLSGTEKTATNVSVEDGVEAFYEELLSDFQYEADEQADMIDAAIDALEHSDD